MGRWTIVLDSSMETSYTFVMGVVFPRYSCIFQYAKLSIQETNSVAKVWCLVCHVTPLMFHLVFRNAKIVTCYGVIVIWSRICKTQNIVKLFISTTS